MRICLYTDTALPKTGGQEMVVDALARHFQELGHAVTVLAPRPRLPLRPRDTALPYPVVRHPRFYSTRFFVSWYRWWLLRLHRRRPFDVLHCHGVYPPGYLAALCRPRLDVPVVITSHGGDVRDGNVRLAKPVLKARCIEGLRSADVLVAISGFTRAGYERLCPQARRVVAIPNGVELEPFALPAPRPSDLDPRIEAGKYVLFLGRVKKRKGTDILLNALALLPAKGGVECVIAGDGEDRAAFEEQARRLQLTDRVRFVGAVFGAAKIYLLQNALATVMATREADAFPLVVLESFASGVPVVATRVPGLQDLIEPGENGLLVAPESPEELAAALRAVIADPGRCRELGARARQVAEAFSWRTVAQRHLELYQELVAERQKSRAA